MYGVSMKPSDDRVDKADGSDHTVFTTFMDGYFNHFLKHRMPTLQERQNMESYDQKCRTALELAREFFKQAADKDCYREAINLMSAMRGPDADPDDYEADEAVLKIKLDHTCIIRRWCFHNVCETYSGMITVNFHGEFPEVFDYDAQIHCEKMCGEHYTNHVGYARNVIRRAVEAGIEPSPVVSPAKVDPHWDDDLATPSDFQAGSPGV